MIKGMEAQMRSLGDLLTAGVDFKKPNQEILLDKKTFECVWVKINCTLNKIFLM